MIEIEIGEKQFDYVMKKLKKEKKNSNILNLYSKDGKIKKEKQYIHSLDVRV